MLFARALTGHFGFQALKIKEKWQMAADSMASVNTGMPIVFVTRTLGTTAVQVMDMFAAMVSLTSMSANMPRQDIRVYSDRFYNKAIVQRRMMRHNMKMTGTVLASKYDAFALEDGAHFDNPNRAVNQTAVASKGPDMVLTKVSTAHVPDVGQVRSIQTVSRRHGRLVLLSSSEPGNGTHEERVTLRGEGTVASTLFLGQSRLPIMPCCVTVQTHHLLPVAPCCCVGVLCAVGALGCGRWACGTHI